MLGDAANEVSDTPEIRDVAEIIAERLDERSKGSG
jgi:hypothetical protein